MGVGIGFVVLWMGCLEYGIYQNPPSAASEELCLPLGIGHDVAPSVIGGQRLGHSTLLISAGSGAADLSEYKYAVSGAPGELWDDESGGFVVRELSRGVGDFLSTPTKDMVVQGSVGQGNLGSSLAAGDIIECHPRSSGGLAEDACGEELLVGAPSTGKPGSAGEVVLYHAINDGIGAFVPTGVLQSPTPVAGDEFGFSMSAAGQWVAVGAPGVEKVFVFPADPTSHAWPFVGAPLVFQPGSLGVPFPGGKDFGYSVLIGDIDSAPGLDLLIGAPTSSGAVAEGAVALISDFAGSASATVFDASHVWSSGPEADEFGSALALGSDPLGGQMFAVGAPGLDTSTGGVLVFNDGGLRHWLKYTGMAFHMSGARMGTSVAIGNFYSADSAGIANSGTALQAEIAVGAPGAYWDEGVVWVYPGDSFAGAPHTELHNPTIAGLPASPGASTGAGYGSALAAGFVQETNWEDLAVGAPEYSLSWGLMELTKAQLPGGRALASHEGIYEVNEPSGGVSAVKVLDSSTTGDTRLTFADNYSFEILDSSGSQCEVWNDDVGQCVPLEGLSLPVGTSIPLQSAYSSGVCPSTAQTFSGVPLGGVASSILQAADVDVPQAVLDLIALYRGDVDFEYCSTGGTDTIEFDFSGGSGSTGVLNLLEKGDDLSTSVVPTGDGCFDASDCSFVGLPISGQKVSNDLCE